MAYWLMYSPLLMSSSAISPLSHRITSTEVWAALLVTLSQTLMLAWTFSPVSGS